MSDNDNDVCVMGAQEARAITDRIRQSVEDLRELVVTAYRGRVWIALNYLSWHEYCDQEFDHRLKLPRGEREKVVRFLREAGMTIRPIASALGISPQTVQTDLAGVSNQHTCDEPTPSEPSDSVTTEQTPPPPASGSGDGTNSGVDDGKAVGPDGKSYPKKKKRRMTPRLNETLATRFDGHISEIRAATQSIAKMCHTYNWAAPHAELRVTLKLLKHVVEIIEQILAGNEQTTIFDHLVGTDEEVDARIERLPRVVKAPGSDSPT